MSDSRTGVSFSFSSSKRNCKNVKLTENRSFEAHRESSDDKDFIKNVEGNRIQGTEKQKEKQKKELIIPLIRKNRWRMPAAETDGSQPELAEPSDLDQEATREILEEIHRVNNQQDNVNKVDESLAIPLYLQNRVPEGYETDERLDVSLRPDVTTQKDYDAIPVEAFGMAMLRGMGWKPTEGIGLSRKGVAQVVDLKPRPKGLGLGANPAVLSQANGKSEKPKDHEKELKLVVNAFVKVLEGKYKGMYGQIISMDPNTGRDLIKMAVGCIEVEVLEALLQPVSAKEYKDSARVLNKDKYDKYKSKQEKERQDEEVRKEKERKEKKSKRKSRSRSKDRTRDRSRSRERSRSNDRKHRSEKSRKNSKDHDEEKISWVHPNLRVRCVDSRFKDGQYYQEKMVVIDVISKKYCICRTESGKLLENVSISKLETVIPRGGPAYVMVVSGKKRGQICEVLERDKERCVAIVQTLPDRDDVFQLSYNDICEYTGDIRNL